MKKYLPIATIIFLNLLVYLPVINAGFIWDDSIVVYNNPLVQSTNGIWKIWFEPSSNLGDKHYWPLSYTLAWIAYRFFNIHPLGYHLLNLLIHIGNCILIGILLKKLSIPGAWLATVIFAIHPVHVETVAWIIEAKDLLSTQFYLLSLIYLLDLDGEDNWKLYDLSLLFFILGLLTKTMIITLPITFLLLVWWKKDRLLLKEFILTIPFFLIGGLITIFEYFNYKSHSSSIPVLSFHEKLYIIGRNFWFYVSKLLCPLDLVSIYPKWQIPSANFIFMLYPISLFTLFLILWSFHRRWGKGPFVAFAIFFITLFPVLGVIEFGYMQHSYVADRYQYLACLGLIVLFSTGVIHLVQFKNQLTKYYFPICSVLLLPLGFLTYRQTQTYHNLETLFQHNVDINPKAWMAHYNLGRALDYRGEFENAKVHYQQSISLHPEYYLSSFYLGNIYTKTGQYPEAIKWYNHALQIHPNYSEALHNKAVTFTRMNIASPNNIQLSIIEQAVKLKPDLAEGYYNLGIILFNQDKYEDSANDFQQAIKINPLFYEAHNNFGCLLVREGKLGPAIAHFSRATRIKPDYILAIQNLEKSIYAYQSKTQPTTLTLDKQLKLVE